MKEEIVFQKMTLKCKLDNYMSQAKIFAWFYQKWISQIKITSANRIELRQIL